MFPFTHDTFLLENFCFMRQTSFVFVRHILIDDDQQTSCSNQDSMAHQVGASFAGHLVPVHLHSKSFGDHCVSSRLSQLSLHGTSHWCIVCRPSCSHAPTWPIVWRPLCFETACPVLLVPVGAPAYGLEMSLQHASNASECDSAKTTMTVPPKRRRLPGKCYTNFVPETCRKLSHILCNFTTGFYRNNCLKGCPLITL